MFHIHYDNPTHLFQLVVVNLLNETLETDINVKYLIWLKPSKQTNYVNPLLVLIHC